VGASRRGRGQPVAPFSVDSDRDHIRTDDPGIIVPPQRALHILTRGVLPRSRGHPAGSGWSASHGQQGKRHGSAVFQRLD
jgi:hypothetical protein